MLVSNSRKNRWAKELALQGLGTSDIEASHLMQCAYVRQDGFYHAPSAAERIASFRLEYEGTRLSAMWQAIRILFTVKRGWSHCFARLVRKRTAFLCCRSAFCKLSVYRNRDRETRFHVSIHRDTDTDALMG